MGAVVAAVVADVFFVTFAVVVAKVAVEAIIEMRTSMVTKRTHSHRSGVVFNRCWKDFGYFSMDFGC